MPTPPLGSIVYLNSTEIDNLLEGIEGGLVEQFRETSSKTKGRRGETAIKIPLTDTGVSGFADASSTDSMEIVRTSSPVGRLSRLRKLLIENDWLTYVDTTDLDTREAIGVGDLVEIRGEIVPSSFGALTEQIRSILELTERFGGLLGISGSIGPEQIQAMKWFADVGQKVALVYVRPPQSLSAKRAFDYACLLEPGKLRVAHGDLLGTVTLLGRVKQRLLRNEIKYPYEFIPGQAVVPAERMKVLIKSLASGKRSPLRFEENDLRVKYPSVIVSPYAIYQ